eukprot:TRINITY_DN2640_c0_g1_i1.p1 TRINITY_DN2640_c0_g1~~TRINITY_DN2640_c0_g1_i1.p1  ORF type:complete len:597 (-),score=140.94 TRINITY_DN2640_c0_g1_i1:30-1820(-)
MIGAIVDQVLGLVFQILGIAFAHPILASIGLLGLFLYSTSGYYRGRRPGIKISYDNFPRKDEFTGQLINCVCPATGEKLGTEHAASKEEVEECVRKAQIAQEKWAQVSFEERKAVLRDIMETVLVNKDDICRASSLDTGKTIFEAMVGEVMITCEKIRYTCKYGESYLSADYRKVPLMLGFKSASVQYYPMGVIGCIVPWNYPFHNCTSAVISSMFAGNATIVKFSEFASWSRSYYQELVQSVLKARGHDPNLVQFLPGYGDTGAALVQAKGVSKILFIGSPGVGRKVMETAAKNLTPVILELGGKDPLIVCEDADFEFAVEAAIRGSFLNCGQNCIAAERIYVHKSVYDKFVARVTERLKTIPQGFDAVDGRVNSFGSMTMPAQLEKVEGIVNDAVSRGATVVAGGKRNTNYKGGLFYEPTVLTNVNHEMKVVADECFGPIMPIIPWETEEQLLKWVNGTEYGLCASIFSKNLARANRIGKAIISGMCVVNDFGLPYLIQDCPFGGCKVSGFGRFNGPEGLRGFAREQTVITEKFYVPPALKAPRLVSYPIPTISPPVIGRALDMFYAWGLGAKVEAVKGIVSILLKGGEQKKTK